MEKAFNRPRSPSLLPNHLSTSEFPAAAEGRFLEASIGGGGRPLVGEHLQSVLGPSD